MKGSDFSSVSWEQRKVGEILQTLPFKQFLKEPEQNGIYKIIQQGNEPVIGYANGIPCEEYEDTVIFGDHTLSLYKPKSPFFVATDGVRIVKGKNNMNGFYLMAMLEKYKPHNEGYKRYYSILSDQECYLTEDKDEQQQIGTLFSNLDILITLHQRKFFHIKIDCFRLRMISWEQRKLGDLTDLYVGQSFSKELELAGKYIVMDMGTVSPDGQILDTKHTKVKRDLLKKNDLIMPKDDIGGGLIIAKTAYIPADNQYVLGDHVYRLRFSDADGLFMHFLINSPEINRAFKKKVTGSAQLGIKAENVKNQTVFLPNIEEQQEIGKFLYNLDNLITLHQRKKNTLEKAMKME